LSRFFAVTIDRFDATTTAPTATLWTWDHVTSFSSGWFGE
jgi:hypothetical protein